MTVRDLAAGAASLDPDVPPRNEPVRDHAPGSPERAELVAKLEELGRGDVELPLWIGGERVRGEAVEQRMPHALAEPFARVHLADRERIHRAIDAARAAWPHWSGRPWRERAEILLRAADLLAGRYRSAVNAATMLGQSKTAHQAEIDAACELVDFWRFNPWYAARIEAEQPLSPEGVVNAMDYRALEGFVLAITPFNFTSIGGNLPTSAALMGNTVVWKPATAQAFSAQIIMDVLAEAGLPDGVISLVYGRGAEVGGVALAQPDLAGVHFTGSTAVFQGIWREVGANLDRYRNHPRLVGETGGKDFVIAHASADVAALATALVRGAFEYQGQKCSAASRLYVPASLWPSLRDRLVADIDGIAMGDVRDLHNFMGAVVERAAYDRVSGAIERARRDPGATILAGGRYDDQVGYFIRPTLVEVRDPRHALMREELFGPVLTVYVYPDASWHDALRLVDSSTPYGLTGAVFAQDDAAIAEAEAALRWSAGNFYVNDKPTGAVVGQQPFGGARASGTNDKAGSLWNLIRWTSPRAVKRTFSPPKDYRYPFMK